MSDKNSYFVLFYYQFAKYDSQYFNFMKENFSNNHIWPAMIIIFIFLVI